MNVIVLSKLFFSFVDKYNTYLFVQKVLEKITSYQFFNGRYLWFKVFNEGQNNFIVNFNTI